MKFSLHFTAGLMGKISIFPPTLITSHNEPAMTILLLLNVRLFKVVLRTCCGAYIVAHIFKHMAPNFISESLHDAALLNFLYS